LTSSKAQPEAPWPVLLLLCRRVEGFSLYLGHRSVSVRRSKDVLEAATTVHVARPPRKENTTMAMQFTVSDQAEKEIRRLRRENSGKRIRIRELTAERDALRAELDALRGVE
jgi:hypothetical protein